MTIMLQDLLDPFNQTLFTLFNAPTSVAEVLGFITGGCCVWLVVKENIWNFPVGMANNFFFLLIFFGAGLYADGSLQIVYFALGAAGWWAWLKLGPGHSKLTLVTNTSFKLLTAIIVGVIATTAILTPILVSVNDSAPFWDALTTSISLGAQTLLNLKKIQSWYFWAIADVIYIPLYVSKGLVLTAIIYGVFLGMVFLGWRAWRRTHKAQLIEGPGLVPAVTS